MPATILIVDDEPDMLRLMVAKVAHHFPAVQVLTASGGLDALRLTKTYLPDVVLLDINMPGPDGLEVCKRLTSEPATSATPVILFTGYCNDEEHRTAGFANGAMGFLCKPIRDEEFVSQVRAIFRLREKECDLRAAQVLAEQASEAKSVLLAGISHEFRTPLNAVVGFSQTLLDEAFGALNEKQKEYVRHIHESGQQLSTMVSNILDLANLGVDASELDIQPLKIADLFAGIFDFDREHCTRQGITLNLDLPEELAALKIPGDLGRLRQIMKFLLANAVKFTPRAGVINVAAVKTARAVQISVADAGIGIAKEDLERVFSPFFQAQMGHTNKIPGIGLSLSLANRLVRLHGGRMWAESAGMNQGSRFTFTLPLAATESSERVGLSPASDETRGAA